MCTTSSEPIFAGAHEAATISQRDRSARARLTGTRRLHSSHDSHISSRQIFDRPDASTFCPLELQGSHNNVLTFPINAGFLGLATAKGAILSDSVESYISTRVLVAGIAIAIRMTKGIMVQMISMVTLP